LTVYDDLMMAIDGVDSAQIEGATLKLTIRVLPTSHDFKVGEERRNGVRVIAVSRAEDGSDEVRLVVPGRIAEQAARRSQKSWE